MSAEYDEFIQLNRTFHELVTSEEGGDDVEMRGLFGREAPIRWPELLQEARVVLLSEAGSGKTEEIRHVTRQLRADGKPAFFIRIEHVVQDFESSFEEGTFEEFEAWVTSSAEGWLLREVSLRQWPRVVTKEVTVGLLNGLAIAATTALAVFAWSRSLGLVIIISCAMVISMIAAGFAGALVPITLRRFGQDPAASSSIILTTVTDVVGFFSFLGIATLFSGMLEA